MIKSPIYSLYFEVVRNKRLDVNIDTSSFMPSIVIYVSDSNITYMKFSSDN